jgi:4-hydroxy-tetrahydrodipicolinate reductase
MPSFTLSCEAVFGADNERLTIRHDAGASAAPYVAGTLLAARRVASFTGLRRGLDAVMD